MYVTFIDYFTADELPSIRQIIYDCFIHNFGLEADLYLLEPLDFDVISAKPDDVTIWLRQSGRETMGDTIDDLSYCLDAQDWIDWSKIPSSIHRHGELQ